MKIQFFYGNQGTPLSVKHKEKTYLSFKEEIHFTNNTGVLGGACGLHNVHVKIHTNADIKVIFEDNTGVYGGAVYLNNATISDPTCKMKVTFINNTATRSGNSVYFATTPREVLPNCSFDNIHLIDISSPAFDTTHEGDKFFH